MLSIQSKDYVDLIANVVGPPWTLVSLSWIPKSNLHRRSFQHLESLQNGLPLVFAHPSQRDIAVAVREQVLFGGPEESLVLFGVQLDMGLLRPGPVDVDQECHLSPDETVRRREVDVVDEVHDGRSAQAGLLPQLPAGCAHDAQVIVVAGAAGNLPAEATKVVRAALHQEDLVIVCDYRRGDQLVRPELALAHVFPRRQLEPIQNVRP